MMALPPMNRNKRRKKKCIIVSIISVIIITAIIVAIHFYVQWVKSAPCNGIPGCQLIKTLGSGTFGDVYHVQISGAEPPDAALKVFKDVPGFPTPKEVLCKFEKDSLLEIANNEGRDRLKLQIGHVREDIPGVGCPRVMLEYIDGTNVESLDEFCGEPMSELVEFCRSMMVQINNNALVPMHNWDTYHGDIKTGNIVYDSNNKTFYLVDFGVTVSLTSLKKGEGIGAFWGGTLLFMGKDHVDIYWGLVPLQKILEDKKRVRRAERYSLAMSAITFIGQNCEEPEEPLCKLGKAVMAEWNQFPPNAARDFPNFSKKEIEAIMQPIWTLIRDGIAGRGRYSGRNQRLMEMFYRWEVHA